VKRTTRPRKSKRSPDRQKEIDHQQVLLNAIFESSNDAIMAISPDGITRTWNRAAELLYGYTADEVVGKPADQFLPRVVPADRMAQEAPLVERAVRGERVPPYETMRIRKDGSPIHVSVSLAPICNANGKVLGFSRTVRDITERKAHEEQTAFLTSIVQSSNDGIAGITNDGIIRTWNHAAELIYGYSAAEVIGTSALSFARRTASKDVFATEKEIIARIIAGEPVAPFETVRIRKDGSRVDVQITLASVRCARGRVLGISSTIRDITERKLQEQQKALLSAVVESSNDAVLTKTLDGTITSWNAAAEGMFGYTADEMIGSSMASLIPPDRADEEDDILRRVRLGEAVRHFETVRLRKNGPPLDVSVSISPIRDARGTVIGASKTMRDITERKRAEETLRVTLESIGDGFFAVDAKWRFVYVNAPAERLMGMNREELLGKNFWDVFPATLGETLEREYRRAAAGEATSFESFYGPWRRWFSNRCFPREGGGISVYFQDVTARRRADEDVRSNQAKLEAALRSMTDAMFITDAKGSFVHINDAFATFHRFPNLAECVAALNRYPELIEMYSADGQVLPFEQWPISRALRGEVGSVELRLRRKDTGQSWLASVNFAPITDSDRTLLGAVLTERDITEQRASETRLQSMRNDLVQVGRLNELGQVSAGIAHELNQPLSAMLNYSNAARRLLARGDPRSFEKAHAAVSKATEQATRAGEIVVRMRALIEKWQSNRRIENINTIIKDAIALETIGVQPENTAIHLALAAEPPPILADRMQIQHVLVNLLRNAFDAVAEAPRRELRISSRSINDAEVEVAVADTGHGIPEEMADRLFMPFFTTKTGGMGIGLVISQSIIEAHGGRISVRPNEGGGTIFQFRLPAAPNATHRGAA
jgi:two-component system sensor kinase FixL